MANQPEIFEAFISYRQAEPDRWWAKWLQKELEDYRCPKELVKRQGVRSRLSKLFRDEDELAASSDLTGEVNAALERSRFLIVVCSPRSAASRWVNAEVRRFCELGRADKILALLIEGEPAAAFPPALLDVRPARVANDKELAASEPLAADVRDEATCGGREKRRLAKLRLLAALLGCGFDDLRQREQERRRRRTAAVALGVVMLATAVTALLWGLKHQAANRLREQQNQELAAQAEERGRHDLLAGDPLRAAQDLDAGYQVLAQDPSYRLLLNSALNQCKGLAYVLRGHAGKVQRIDVQAKQPFLLTQGEDGAARVWNLNSGMLVRLFGKDGDKFNRVKQLQVDLEGRYALFLSGTESYVYDFGNRQTTNLQVTSPDETIGEAYLAADGKRVVGSVARIEKGKFITRIATWNVENGSQMTSSDFAGQLAIIGISPSGKQAFGSGRLDQAVNSPPNFQTQTLFSVDAETGNIAGQMTVGGFDDIRPSLDGKRILVAHKRGLPAVYAAETLERLFQLSAPNVMPLNAYWAPSGKLIRSADHAGVTIWDAMTGKPIRSWTNLVCSAAAIDGSDQFLATATSSGEINIWEISTGNLLRVIQDQIGWPEPQGFFVDDTCLRFSPDGQFLIFAGNSSVVKIWDWKNSRSVRLSIASGANRVNSGAFSPDGKWVALGNKDASVLVASSLTGQPSLTLRDSTRTPGEEIPAIRFSPDGTRLLAGSFFGDAKLWDLENGKLLKTMGFDKQAVVLADTIRIAVNPSGTRCVTLSSNGRGALWDMATLGQVASFEAGQLVHFGDVEFSGDGSRFIVAGSDGLARIFDSTHCELKATLGPAGKSLTAAEFGPLGKTALSVDLDGLINVWDLATGKTRLSLNQNGPRVNEVHFSLDGNTVLASAGDNKVHLWDATTGQSLREFTEEKLGGEPFDLGAPIDFTLLPGSFVRTGFISAKFSPDGNFIAAGNDNGRICLWDAKSGKQLLKLAGHVGRITSIVFNRDGSRILTCGEDGKANVWDISLAEANTKVARESIRHLITTSEPRFPSQH
jgi:WD40 repeat protein